MCGNQGETSLKNIGISLNAEELRALIEVLLALPLKYLVIFPLEENAKYIQNGKHFPHMLLRHRSFSVLFL